ncbi:hypothetical protein ACFLQQ_01605 [Actinomycetota bacterium]
MPKKNFLIRKFEGQIEEWDDEIYRLTCEIRDTSEEGVKSECEKKIGELQLKRSNAEDEIIKLKKEV